jgi:hypothetical protein
MASVFHLTDPKAVRSIVVHLTPDEASSVAVALETGSGGFGAASGLWDLSNAIGRVVGVPGKLLISDLDIDSDRYDDDVEVTFA